MTVGQAQKLRAVARWHRRIAVLVAAWLVFLALTGLSVNHANDWGLDSRPLPAFLQQGIYGVAGGGPDYCAAYPETGAECAGLFAVLDLPDGALLLHEHSLYLLDASGGMVERLPISQAGLDVLQAGFADGDAVWLRGGGRGVQTSPELLAFNVQDEAQARGLEGADWMERNPQVGHMSWERLLLDLHAARFLGPFSKAFNDVAAVLILLLGVSGGWLHRLKRKANGA